MPEVLQGEVVRQAKKESKFNPWFDLLGVITVVAPWALWAVKPAAFGESGLGGPIVALFPLLMLTVHTMFVRRAITMIGTRLCASLAADA